MIAIATSERNGRVVAATLVHEQDEIMLITTGGVLIRTRVAEIRTMGRATQGVTLIALDPNTTLSRLQRVVETDAEPRDPDAAAAPDAESAAAPEFGSPIDSDSAAGDDAAPGAGEPDGQDDV
jgi:DNA gyrase subunit A